MVERDMDSGAFVIPNESDHTTLAQALERYWEDIASKKRHPSQERQRINHWCRTTPFSVVPAQLARGGFRQYRDARRAAAGGRTPSA